MFSEIIFSGIKRNEDFIIFRLEETKLFNPRFSLDVCFLPEILLGQFVSMLTNHYTTVLKHRNYRFCSTYCSDRRPFCSSSSFLNSSLRLLSFCFYFFFPIWFQFGDLITEALQIYWGHFLAKYWIVFQEKHFKLYLEEKDSLNLQENFFFFHLKARVENLTLILTFPANI